MLSSLRLLCCYLALIAALVTATSAIHCPGSDYTVREPGKEDRCITCGDCHPGYGRDPPCGSVLKHPPNTFCKPCEKGTFSDAEDSKPCKACHQCTTIVAKKCTNTSNTECSGKCQEGSYYENASHNCQKCSHCCGDEQDIIIEECTNQGMPKDIRCTIHRAKDCNPPDQKVTPRSTTLANGHRKDTPFYVWIIVVIAGILVGLCVIGIFWHYRNNSRRNLHGHGQAVNLTDPGFNGVTVGLQVSLPDVVASTAYNELEYQRVEVHGIQDGNGNAQASEEKPPDTLAPKSFGNPSFSPSPGVTPKGTPSHTDDELEEDTAVKKKQAVSPPKSNSDAPKTVVLQKKRSNSIGSQEGKEGKSSSRRPSLSLSRQLSRKASYSLMDEEELPKHQEEEPGIIITKHPRPRVEIIEGERLELRCEATGPRDMSYQWLKNREPVHDQTSSTLVVSSAKVKDFGRYACRVGKKESKTAEVDVKPRQGTRLKLLSSMDGETKDKICIMLKSKRKARGGLGGWKQLARKYSMDRYSIEELDDTKNPAESVLEYLGGRYCNLTVYDFIKSLTSPEIMRNDVVSMILSDLTEEDSGSDML